MILYVALLAEGVDRNPLAITTNTAPAMSPSSRRAWIEITCPGRERPAPGVALLAEGVDRNDYDARDAAGYNASPSSRRAWIEI